MKKRISLIVALLMMLSVVGVATADTSRYDVTEIVSLAPWNL